MVKQRKITAGDIRMFQYFWQEKEAIERYGAFDELQEDMKERLLPLYDAIQRYKSAKQTLDMIIDNLDEFDFEEDEI